MGNFKEINKAVKVRLYPTKQQEFVFNQNINHARFVFNKVKESCEYHYQIIKEHGFEPRYLTTRKFTNIILTQLKQNNDFLYISDSTSLQASCDNYINSMKNFFNYTAKFPRFKSKRNLIQSFKVKNSMDRLRIKDNKLKIGKHGFVKIRGLRHTIGKILSITVSKIANKWFASIVYNKFIVEPLSKTKQPVGIDVGIRDLAILSTGEKITKLNSSHLESKIVKLQKNLSRKIKGSKNYLKNKDKLANAHLKLKNLRSDYIHKLTWKLVTEFDTIVLEDLKISTLLKNHRLAKSISHASWFELRRQLEYKCDWYDKQLIVVNPHYTSKECSQCGFINKELSLNTNSWICPSCDTIHDRDINAAVNILNRWCDGDSLVID